MMLLLSFSFVLADGEIVNDVSIFSDTVILENNIPIYETLPETSWWDNFFGMFSFVDINSQLDTYQECELDDAFGSFDKPAYKLINSGGSCNVGQYILYQSNGGDIYHGTNLFSDAWYKSSSTDLPNLADYYTNELSFRYSYACYDCNFIEKYSCDWGSESTESECLDLRDDMYLKLNDCDSFDIIDCINDIKQKEPCDWSSSPDESECMDLRDDMYDGLNDCDSFDIIDCMRDIKQLESCDWSSSPDEDECMDLRDDMNDEINDCDSFDIIDCIRDIPVITTTTTTSTTTTTMQKITCYSCLGQDLIEMDFEGYSCPTGTSDSSIDCEIITEEIICYSCVNGSVESNVFNTDSCPSGYFEEAPTCGNECKPYQENIDSVCKTQLNKWFNYIFQMIKDWFARIF